MILSFWSQTAQVRAVRLIRRSDLLIYDSVEEDFGTDDNYISVTEQLTKAKGLYASADLTFPTGQHSCDMAVYDVAEPDVDTIPVDVVGTVVEEVTSDLRYCLNWMLGKWIDNPDEEGTYLVLDYIDKVTPVLKVTPGLTSPYVDVSIL